MKFNRNLIALLAAGSILTSGTAFAATDVYQNGKLLPTAQEVHIVDGRTLMGFRDYFTATGIEVNWHNDTRTASAQSAIGDIIIRPDDGFVSIGGKSQTLDVPPQIINGHVYLPLRFFSEALGYTVNFQQKDGKNIVTMTNQAVPASGDTLANHFGGSETDGFYLTDGHLMHLKWQQGHLDMQTVDKNSGRILNTQRFKLGGGDRSLSDLFFNGTKEKGVSLVLSEPANPKFVGSGTPRFVSPEAVVHTQLGDLPLYETSSGYSPYQVTARGVHRDALMHPGYALDVSALPAGTRQMATLGSKQVYLLNGHLLVLEPELKNPLLHEEAASADVLVQENSRVVAAGIKGSDLSVYIVDSNGKVTRQNKTLTPGRWTIADTLSTSNGSVILLSNGSTSVAVRVDDRGQCREIDLHAPYTHLLPDLDTNLVYAYAIDQSTFTISEEAVG